MTPRQDLLDHAVNLFPAPQGSIADVQRHVARRHRNRRLGAVVVVLGLWVILGVAATRLRTDDTVPMQSPTPAASPTVAPATVDARGWPTTSRNKEGVYSWDGRRCAGQSCNVGFMHNAYSPGSGDISIVIYGVAGNIEPHHGTPVRIFGYEGSYQRSTGDPATGGPRASCELWMVDVQGTTVTIRLCAKPGAPADEVAEAHKIVESMRVESPHGDTSGPGFQLVFALRTNTWDSG
jgi:hypothetical protein